ncbi:AAA family ATPase [Streptomyces sp. NPDC046984]
MLTSGLPGAGKTTYAMELVRRGYVRLSIDEAVMGSATQASC